MNKTILVTACVLGIFGIILGALGAHKLQEYLNPSQLISFETGVRYQMYSALFLLVLGGMNFIDPIDKTWVYRLAVLGVIMFSFSIYLLATRPIHGMSLKFLGPITPIGGVLMIASWVVLLLKLLKNNS